MIRFDAVSKTFPGRRATNALVDLELEVQRGETLCLVGASGSGKTTALRLVNRMLEPSAGRVLLEGADIGTHDPVSLRRGMGYVVQRGGLFPHLDVARNVGILARFEGWDTTKIKSRVDELLRLVRLDPEQFASRFPRELSGGQRQRVGVARALMLDPPVLLMDEPFGALDPLTRAELHAEFTDVRRAAGARTTLIVTHDLDEARKLGDRIALLDSGRLLQVGTPHELESSPASDEVRRFLGYANEGGRDAS